MGVDGVDYAWTHPSPASLAAAGFSFACRYLSNDPSKNISRGEADALAAVGVWVVSNWESTATRASTGGYEGGVTDARRAVAEAEAAGMPPGRPIYFSVDEDTTGAAVRSYFAGVLAVVGAGSAGAYGSTAVLDYLLDAGLIQWAWRTMSTGWRGGANCPRAHILQTGSVTVGGVDCDADVARVPDYGQWQPGRLPDPPLVPYDDEEDEPMRVELSLGFGYAGHTPAQPDSGTIVDVSRIATVPYEADNGGAAAMPVGYLSVACGEGGPVRLRLAFHRDGDPFYGERRVIDIDTAQGRVYVGELHHGGNLLIGRVKRSANDTSDQVPVAAFIAWPARR